MPPTNDLPTASLALAAGLGMIALFLGLRQWYERRARDPDLSEPDRIHFSYQDWRRRAGVGVMLAIALLVLIGSNTEPRVQGRPNVIFLTLWIAVMALILVMLVLALADLAATRTLARRHRQQMLRDSIEIVRREAASRARKEDQSSPDPDSPG